MFDKSIQFPSVAILSFVFSCIAHSTLADAKVYSVTAHGNARVDSEVKMEKPESVELVKKLRITVPKYGQSSYAEIKGDLYFKVFKVGKKRLVTAHDKDKWFDFSLTGLKHGGPFGKEKFILRVWCNNSGSDGYIVRGNIGSIKPKNMFIVGHISCVKG
ncbi:hypothetical protein [Candidatus Sororendozoicomonas aggregata]|uniref:hypothetical protein n=1 Tax=Candidatus Sororendozoicomonas aggregata TaxID=3073239 RepID=UPI002ED5D6B1